MPRWGSALPRWRVGACDGLVFILRIDERKASGVSSCEALPNPTLPGSLNLSQSPVSIV